jgi:hypothetical protein
MNLDKQRAGLSELTKAKKNEIILPNILFIGMTLFQCLGLKYSLPKN